MKNVITQYFENISDSDLKSAIIEIRYSDDSGYIGDIVRGHAKKISELTNNVQTTLDLTMAQINLMKQASYRWINTF